MVFSLTPSPSKGLNGVKRNILADFPIQIRLRRFLSDPLGDFHFRIEVVDLNINNVDMRSY